MRLGKLANTLLALLVLVVLSGCQMPSFGTRHHAPREPGVVILLPGDGPYSGIASKILEGAKIARDELRGNGIPVTLAFIDTSKKGWQQKLHDLPARFSLVGGPIERTAYTSLKKSGLLQDRTFFAFLNNLDGADEGGIAYRFFPSPDDQAEALVDFATDALKIRSFGSFHGNDAYSTKMAGLFAAKVRAKNCSLRTAVYQSTDSKTLAQGAGVLINPVQSGGSTLPQTSFEAVFLPCSWRYVDPIVKSFEKLGEDRLVLLGTASWEQSVARKGVTRKLSSDLAVLPVAWNSRVRMKALEKVNVEFWHALGYDFMHFAVNMNLQDGASGPMVVQAANRASSIVRLLAPLHWDARGIAHQKLFIERVTSEGMAPMDVAYFEALRLKHREKAAIRMQGGVTEDDVQAVRREVRTVPEPVVTESVEKPAQYNPEPRVSEPVLQTPPPSSYKLRLPAKRK